MIKLAHDLGYRWFIYINLDTTGRQRGVQLMRALPVAYREESEAKAVLAACCVLNPTLRTSGDYQLFRQDNKPRDWNIMRVGQLDVRYRLATHAEITWFSLVYTLPEELCILSPAF